MTTYTFTGAVAYDRLGSSWRTAAGLRSVSVTDPATGLLPANLVQGGVAVSWLTADVNSRYSFTCDVPGVVVDFGAGAEALYANEVPGLAIAAGAVNGAAIDARMKWAPLTAYTLGQQILSPNNDVAKANVAHTSAGAYATDVAKWDLSVTFGTPAAVAAAYVPANIFLGVGGFDPVTLTGPDDSALFQAAVDRAAAEPDLGRRIIKVKPGCYKISVPITGIPAYLQVVGDGVGTTRLCYTGTGVMFDVGTYTTTPGGLYEGTKPGFTLKDIWIDVPGTSFTNEGSRVPTCVRDNANGSMRFDHAKISGFAFGLNGAWGSDFTEFHDSAITYCDVGVYLGPGSQQVRVNGVMFMGNRESAVIERSMQGSIKDCQFVDSSVADITVVFNATSIRSGIATTNGSGFNFADWAVEDCWFESGAFTGRTPCPQHILTTSDTPGSGYPQYLKVIRPTLVSGGTASATDAFWRVASGTRFLLEGLTVYGGEIKYAVDTGTWTPAFVQRNTRQTDGSGGNALVLWGGTGAATCQYEDTIAAVGTQGIAATHAVRKARVIGDAFERWHQLANGKQEFGGGTAAPDMYVDWVATAVMRLGGGTVRISPALGSQSHLDLLPVAAQTVSYLRARTSAGAVAGEIDLNGNWHGGVFTKAGALVDADFGVVRDGLWGVNTTASTIMVRIGGVWKSTAALT